LQRALGFRLLALRQLVQHIAGLVHPAALAAGLGPHFLDRLLEAERAVGDRELGPDRKPASLQVEEKLLSGLRTFANAVDQTDELLLALGRGANDYQQALRGVLEPGLDMNASAQKYMWRFAERSRLCDLPPCMRQRPFAMAPFQHGWPRAAGIGAATRAQVRRQSALHGLVPKFFSAAAYQALYAQATPTAENRAMTQVAEQILASAGPTRLGNTSTTVPLAMSPESRQAPALQQGAATSSRTFLTIEGLEYDEAPGGLYNVFLRGTGDRREQIGGDHAGPAGHAAHQRTRRSFRFDVTDAVKRLDIRGDASPSLVFEPTTASLAHRKVASLVADISNDRRLRSREILLYDVGGS
jgi:hypothetical protein